ncbi:MAG: sigma 54-interacting transcriptional regulator [Myxococcales bacterium]
MGQPTIYALKDGVTRRVFEALDDGSYLVGTGGKAELVVDPAECREELLCQLEVSAGRAVVTETGEAKLRVGGVDPGFRTELANGRPVSAGEWDLLAVWPAAEPANEAPAISELPPTAGAEHIVPASKELALKVYKERRFQIVKAVPGLTFGRDPRNHFSWPFDQLSRFHARIVDTVQGLQIEDLDSAYATFVNGVELRRSRAVLREGMIVTFSDLGLAPRLEVISARQATADRLREEPRHAIIGECEALVETLRIAAQLAQGAAIISILAERGTGKEGLARYVWQQARPRRPFVTVDCSALPPTLFHAELFGAVKGAYTDGKLERLGLFREARGGVIFLDEAGKLPLPIQAALLTVLNDGTVRPVGSDKSEAVDVLVIVATNVRLSDLVARGEFLPDLADRIGEPQLTLPPLRERRGDIAAIAAFHLAERARLPHRPLLSDEAIALLVAQEWPGNIRQLCRVVEVAALRTAGPSISAETVQAVLAGVKRDAVPAVEAAVRLAPVEAEALERAICLQAKASSGREWKQLWKELGYTSDQQLYRRLKKWGVS